ncbi:MAG: hypothetical protein HP495_17350, partial [Nitrospira sp.]|nr:hypothetical protein [Nitrospira sp.]
MSVQLTEQLRFLPRLAIQLVVLLLCGWASAWSGERHPDIEVFVRAGCPHCEAAKIFLDDLRRERPSLQIALYDIAADATARQRLATLARDRGIITVGVPTFLIGTEVIVGFQSADTTGAEI